MSESSKVAQGRHLIVKMIDGLSEYEPVWKAMQDYTDTRDEHSEDQLWVLQHQPVFTQGQAGKAEHVLAPGNIPVVKSDRGGQVTYHGPGQIVIYFLLDIGRLNLGARDLVSAIENAMINTLALYGIEAIARQDAPGVYVDGKKIGSIGLRIRAGKTFHGLSLNVDMDLEPFGRINPCGYSELEMTQLANFEGFEAIEQASGRLVRSIQESFGYDDIMMDYSESLDKSDILS